MLRFPLPHVPGVGFVLVALFAGTGPAAAEPAIRGNFTMSCASTVVERSVSPGEDVGLVFGVSEVDSIPHRSRVALEISSPTVATLPDAWRFDGGGCQDRPYGLMVYTWIAAAVKTCPTNMLPQPSMRGVETHLAADGRALRIDILLEYPEPTDVTWTIERFLLALVLSHYWSVIGPSSDPEHCGGLEAPICIRLVDATYEDFAGVVRSYRRVNEVYAVQEPGGAAACGAVPAQATTWGSIKGQYR